MKLPAVCVLLAGVAMMIMAIDKLYPFALGKGSANGALIGFIAGYSGFAICGLSVLYNKQLMEIYQ